METSLLKAMKKNYLCSFLERNLNNFVTEHYKGKQAGKDLCVKIFIRLDI